MFQFFCSILVYQFIRIPRKCCFENWCCELKGDEGRGGTQQENCLLNCRVVPLAPTDAFPAETLEASSDPFARVKASKLFAWEAGEVQRSKLFFVIYCLIYGGGGKSHMVSVDQTVTHWFGLRFCATACMLPRNGKAGSELHWNWRLF